MPTVVAQDLPEAIAAIDRERERRAAIPKSPLDFAKKASNGRYFSARHIELLNEKLLALSEGRIKRLIVTMPPRHSKSETCSKYFPAWFLGKFPDKRVILCSYEAEFAAGWGQKARDLLDEFGPAQFGVNVRDDARARNDWKIDGHDGGMVTAGVGGPITGKGADLLIVDDPVKNSEEASSKTYREKAWDWWQSTAFTRLEPDGVALVIMTRWHEDDLAGKLLKPRDADDDDPDEKWEVLNLPAIAEDNDQLGRKPGEALWPERWPLEKLKRREKRLDVYFWYSLYQQRPLPPGGEIFNRGDFRYFTCDSGFYRLSGPDGKQWVVKAEDCTKFATVDVATSEKRLADFTVMQVWAMTPSYDLLLLDQWREQAQAPKVATEIIRIYNAHELEFVGVEKQGVGLPLIQTLRQHNVTVKPLNAKGDKVMRSQAAQIRMQAGMIHFPMPVESRMNRVLREELETFPKSAHDDCVDALCYGAIVAHRQGGSPSLGSKSKEELTKDAEAAEAKREARNEALTSDAAHPGSAIAPAPEQAEDPDAQAWLKAG